jgi:hypothetical protein
MGSAYVVAQKSRLADGAGLGSCSLQVHACHEIPHVPWLQSSASEDLIKMTAHGGLWLLRIQLEPEL